ncbi:XRE family transcriptional regulator [Enterococcus sp.]|uniref:XRE family transcriptional regulator n=1 Tax=Enterococcus sp. TaxID=35783 RepID=UPI00399666D3
MFQITLKAARVNSDLKQDEVVSILKDKFGILITRQRLAEYEKDATDVPISLAKKLSKIYGIPDDHIFFGNRSTLSYTFRNLKKEKAG